MHSKLLSLKRLHPTDLIIGFALLAGFFFSLASFVELCTEQCEDGKKYFLFGMPFALVGLLFFSTVAVTHYLSVSNPFYSKVTGVLVASAVGAESLFIYIQKFVIGTWCPICLSIAACVLIAAAAFSWRYIVGLSKQIQQSQQGEIMESIKRGLGSISVVCLGVLLAFVGLTKFDALEAAENRLKENLAFGNKASNIEIYIFTDWNCKACRELDPYLTRMAPSLMKEGKVVFVDHSLHPESLNYTPYNVSFLLNNKSEYFKLRKMISDMSRRTKNPTEDQIEEGSANLGVTYDQLNYSDVALAIRYFRELSQQFKIRATPTMVIVNTDTRKGKKLKGNEEITRRNALIAIKELTD